jgi:hypothetical protein
MLPHPTTDLSDPVGPQYNRLYEPTNMIRKELSIKDHLYEMLSWWQEFSVRFVAAIELHSYWEEKLSRP